MRVIATGLLVLMLASPASAAPVFNATTDFTAFFAAILFLAGTIAALGM